MRVPTTRIGVALTAAALLILVAGVVIVARPGGRVLPTRAPVAIGTPAAVAAPSAVASAAVASSVAPSGASAAPSGGSAQAGFEPVSVTFVSSEEGWVLGMTPCAGGECTAILRTTDGGQTWTAVGAPATSISQGPLRPGSTPGIIGLRFADPRDGWAYGPDLWATHDGGSSWQRVTIPRLPASAVIVALEASAGTVTAVADDVAGASSDGGVRIASSLVGSDAWTLSPTQVPLGAGPVSQAQLVLAGTAGWIMEVDRIVVGGARLVGGTWSAWTAPCSDAQGSAVLAASSPSDLVAACDGGLWGHPASPAEQGEHLYVSHDGGATFAETGGTVPVQEPLLANPVRGTILVGRGQLLVASFDHGQTWRTVLDLTQPAFITYLGFTTASQVVAIADESTGTTQRAGALYMTRDGGHTWAKVSFSGG
jgi:photosystem II stability/assembly factor-like uncharacterized protein